MRVLLYILYSYECKTRRKTHTSYREYTQEGVVTYTHQSVHHSIHLYASSTFPHLSAASASSLENKQAGEHESTTYTHHHHHGAFSFPLTRPPSLRIHTHTRSTPLSPPQNTHNQHQHHSPVPHGARRHFSSLSSVERTKKNEKSLAKSITK